MNRLPARTKAGQYSWIQVISLALSVVAYMLEQIPIAIGFLLVGTMFGMLATLARLNEAKRIRAQQARAQQSRSQQTRAK